MMTVSSNSIKEYMVLKGDSKANSILMSMQYSMREPPKKREDCELVNNFASMTIPLNLYEDFDKGLLPIKKRMLAIKKSIEPFGMAGA